MPECLLHVAGLDYLHPDPYLYLEELYKIIVFSPQDTCNCCKSITDVDMAEFGYGYHTEFDEPTPLAYEDLGIPEFSKPGAKPTRADADVANLLSKLPLKDGSIDFNIDLVANTGSDISKAIDPTKQVNFIAIYNIRYLRF